MVMSDIVERLRGFADVFEAQQAPHNLVLHVRAAADEIERLRAGGCARDQGTTQYCAEAAMKDAEIASLLTMLADARTENMRLTAENEKLTEWNREIAVNAREFVAENEKLRAALEPLACTCHRPNGDACSRGEVDCPFWQARAALEEGRSCTCHPSEAPTPCQRKYALGDCIKAALEEGRT
jgi:hypothetical protein